MRLLSKKKTAAVKEKIVRLQDVRLDVLTAGDVFMLD
jgi:hypothetical protein